MGLGDVLILMGMAVLLLMALRSIRRQKKRGGGCCGGGCSECQQRCLTHERERRQREFREKLGFQEAYEARVQARQKRIHPRNRSRVHAEKRGFLGRGVR